MKALRLLTSDDDVIVAGESLKVCQIDRFGQSLLTIRNGSKESTEIQIEEENKSGNTVVQRGRNGRVLLLFVSRSPKLFKHNCLLKGCDLTVAVTDLDLFKFQAQGILRFGLDTLDTECTITIPVNRYHRYMWNG
ncbi:uncharacterized protein LOC117101705 [Anneissia japonica]|uniref:uncharacterized protein LOC117101705 n=1 Tax=Anneissia japonica TaxID=1529436 RepID=UPI0014259365|nr:uncharacterized protein LOC117101705 [Anneissia japonica]